MFTTSPKKKIPYHHHHGMRHKHQTVPTSEPALLAQEVVDDLLVLSIKAICEEEAQRQGIKNPVIESVALESLAAAMDEFMLQFLSKVRRSMTAARRICPIATDFEAAIDVLDVPRPDDQLGPYETQPSVNPPLLPTPPPEDEFHNLVELPASFLGPGLDGHGELKKFSFSTKGLPELPSAHTYKDTPVYPERQSDSRKMRELATQEGKLGEQALRKLAGAVKLDAAHPLEVEGISSRQKPSTIIRRKRWKTAVDLSEEAVFEETLRDLLAKEPGGFELGPIVNCEKAYRMPEEVMVKRRAPTNKSTSDKRSSSGLDGGDVVMRL
ncbi:uncharacterized protein A1O5_03562 [Cladophialophora psammophila CBS 110553]|uniref:Transcription initiation factor TFIID subunit 8 n=1 Tax=Cladophialophora psammophila CBS 110553 TaxID=1182543 RepID=W9X8Y2_9EURO|nr:uncharacterized protein A1O5_03562 [Cladophialophora psammophila CBS 110553]EXJ73800.1 hypothetical protein A1O5_03562 [Cladophialophora psammophila CBS 110553]